MMQKNKYAMLKRSASPTSSFILTQVIEPVSEWVPERFKDSVQWSSCLWRSIHPNCWRIMRSSPCPTRSSSRRSKQCYQTRTSPSSSSSRCENHNPLSKSPSVPTEVWSPQWHSHRQSGSSPWSSKKVTANCWVDVPQVVVPVEHIVLPSHHFVGK